MTNEGQRYTFPKEERLSGKKKIEELFREGSSFYSYPFVVRFKVKPGPSTFSEVLFTVSKKNFKRAVDRNLVKRRMREAYRLNKYLLYNSGFFYYLGIVYTDKSILTYGQIEEKLTKALRRLMDQTLKGHE